MKAREVTFLVTALILGAVLGGLLGELIGGFLPDGAARTLFTKAIEIGFSPVTLSLYTITFTIGLMVKINFMSALVVLLVIFYFKFWYL